MNDVGSENYVKSVTDFTESHDIEQSNSMIEACNKILKYSFLYHQILPDYYAPARCFPKAVYEYNVVKPHYAHRYLTPKEVLEGSRVIPD